MRILMTVSATSLMDGINRHVLAIAPALNRQEDMSVAVVTVLPAGELNRALEARGVRVFSLNAAHGHSLPILWRFFRLMRTYRPDVVHLHVRALFELVVLRFFFPHVRYVETAHGIGDANTVQSSGGLSFEWLREFGQRLIRLVSTVRISAVCYISNGVRDYFTAGRTFEHIAETIYNPIDFPERMSPAGRLQSYLGLDRSVMVIGSACRFAVQKNLPDMLRVFIRVLERCPTAHAVLFGSGIEDGLDKKIVEHIRTSPVADRLHLPGYCADVRSMVPDMSCFVMTSHWEGMPTSLLEAMSVKTPIAFMRGQGGLVDLDEMNKSEGPFAIVTDAGDVAGLSDGICDLLNAPDKAAAYAECAYRVCRRHFDLETVAGQLRSLYCKVCDVARG